MDLIKEIDYYKKKVFNFLGKKLKKDLESIFLDYSKKNKELFNLYENFIKNGKGIRGSLVFLTDKIFEGKKLSQENLYLLSGFFEIIHATLLIHDDIMDQDKYRRNTYTINFYFQEKLKLISKNSKHLGNSLAINLGDIGLFFGFNLLSKIKTEQKTKEKLFSFLTREYIKVALAQNDDVYYGQTNTEPSIKKIEKIYLYKTARYTFVLPVIATLILKNNPKAKNKHLISILEKLGILFQITDDLIGFLSDETGKDIGSDIRENKKTIIRYYLIKEIKNSKLNLFGKIPLEKEEILKLRKFYQTSKTKKIIDGLISKLKEEIELQLNKSSLPKKFKILVIQFLDFLIKRKK